MTMHRQCMLVMSALSMLLAGCGGGGGGGGGDESEPSAPTPPPAQTTANVTVRLKLTARPTHVESLDLTLVPVSIYRPALSTINVLTDLQGNEMPLTERTCNQQSGQCTDVLSRRSFSLLINAGLYAATVAQEHAIPAGDYNAVRILSVNELGVRDSRAMLDDGRECEVNLAAIDMPIQMHVPDGELWNLNLTLDIGSVDPADCDDGTLELRGVLGIEGPAS